MSLSANLTISALIFLFLIMVIATDFVQYKILFMGISLGLLGAKFILWWLKSE